MPSDIPEPDWRRFKEIHQKLLDRYCRQILEEAAAVCGSAEGIASL